MRLCLACFFLSVVNGFIAIAAPRPITPDVPLILVPAPGYEALDALGHADTMVRAWETAPESLRPMLAFFLESPRTRKNLYADRFNDVLRELDFHDIPVVLHIAADGPETAAPVDAVYEWITAHPAVRGVYISDFAFDDYPPVTDDPVWTPPVYRWLNDILKMTVAADRRFFLELGNDDWTRLMAQPWARAFLEALKNAAPHVVVMNDSRGPGHLARIGAMQGLWYEGIAENWGLTLTGESYTAAHFRTPGVSGVNTDASSMPPNLYRAQTLVGASAGATVYRIGESAPLWFGDRLQVWDEVIGPTFAELIELRAIPQKDWLMRDTHVAYRLNSAGDASAYRRNATDLDGVAAPGFLIAGAYGLPRPGQTPEYIPNTGRYGWVPVLRPDAGDDVIAAFDEVVLPGAMLDARDWTARLDSYYPQETPSEVYISRVGRTYYALHTLENDYAPQRFQIPGLPAPVRGIQAERTPQGVRVSWPFREGDLTYTVWRRLPSETRYGIVADDIDRREFLDAGYGEPDVVYYAVTSLTRETETLEGVLNFGDYRLYSAVESRMAETVELRRYETEAISRPMPVPPLDRRNSLNAREDPFAGETNPERRELARQAVDSIRRMADAYDARDVDALVGLYAENYTDVLGRTRESVRVTYETFFSRFRPGPVHWQVRRGAMNADGDFVLTCYLRFTGVELDDPTSRAVGRTVEFPLSPEREVDIVFRASNPAGGAGALAIVATNPPLPNLSDIFGRAVTGAEAPAN